MNPTAKMTAEEAAKDCISKWDEAVKKKTQAVLHRLAIGTDGRNVCDGTARGFCADLWLKVTCKNCLKIKASYRKRG